VDDASSGFVVPSGPDVLAEVFDGEAVIVHLGTGMYYSFDRRATELWEQLCEDPAGPSDAHDINGFRSFLIGQQLASGADGGQGDAEWPGVSRFSDMADLLLLDPIHDIDLDGSGWPEVPADRAAS